MAVRTWLISYALSSRMFCASVLVCALPLLSPHAAQAQFSQDGPKRVGTGAPYPASQGSSVALSADGKTSIEGGDYDNSGAGAAWVFTRRVNGAWSQQGGKLVGAGAVGGDADQGWSVALAANGDTAIVGGPYDNSNAGAAWVFTRDNNGVWTQQGGKLVGAGAVNGANGAGQGISVALSADGATAIVGGSSDNSGVGAAWVFTRGKNGVWTQQGGKLVGNGEVGYANQGNSLALSANGDTAIFGGYADSNYVGAVWVFTRSNGVWTQQGGKLVGNGFVHGTYGSDQGFSVALSADGDTVVVGGVGDNAFAGAAWVFTRSGGVWSQQGGKLVGSGAVGNAEQGYSVALSTDGDTAIVGGIGDNALAGAAWVFTRRVGVWSQQGGKLVGSGAVGKAEQGLSVSLSGDGAVAIVGGEKDNNNKGAAWLFVQPLEVSPYPGVAALGAQGGSFSPASFSYTLEATSGSVKYAITGVPAWLTASSTSGTVTKTGTAVTFTINASADTLAPGTYIGAIEFHDTDNVQKSISRKATLTVKAK